MRRLATALLVVLMTLLSLTAAMANHNGPYCQAEDWAGFEIFVGGGHDYCE